MMNLGGPKNLDEVQPFLLKLFEDREIIQLPAQNVLGPFIAKRRTKSVQDNYRDIGGGSPILKWTREQGEGMCRRLDAMSPETAPHKFYVAFRYIDPFTEDALRAMHEDGVTRAVAFTQYPQFSCATTGSSLNEVWRAARRLGLQSAFQWSVIDRWPTHPRFIEAMTETVKQGLEQFSERDRDDVVIVFSAHSLPLSVINRGDAYPAEVGATTHEVMKRLGYAYEYLISYQSEVGPVPWLGPSTETVIEELGHKKRRNVLVVGIAFTSDHIETLHELDIEYGELAHKVGITNYKRAPALNGLPLFQDALAEIVYEHLQSGEACSKMYGFRCPGCVNPQCRNILNPVAPYKRTNVTVTKETRLYRAS
ncbi:ferrochelatase [Truepera radiovictrix DSM 17093]|uniref:Ferrochelatase n=2 Tax=Truepera TaxID=332248 RepID=D7CXZ8_TRURR|nr:ferrochelatase [Truepera radiovictrix DSM 17093]